MLFAKATVLKKFPLLWGTSLIHKIFKNQDHIKYSIYVSKYIYEKIRLLSSWEHITELDSATRIVVFWERKVENCVLGIKNLEGNKVWNKIISGDRGKEFCLKKFLWNVVGDEVGKLDQTVENKNYSLWKFRRKIKHTEIRINTEN